MPPPGGLSRDSLPPSASTRSARPRSPAALVVGAADAVVHDLDDQSAALRARRARRSSLRRRACGRWRAPPRRRSRRPPRPALPSARPAAPAARRARGAEGERLQRSGETALGEDGGMEPAGELADLLEARRELVDRQVEQLPAARRGLLGSGPASRAQPSAAAGRRRGGCAGCASARRRRPPRDGHVMRAGPCSAVTRSVMSRR